MRVCVKVSDRQLFHLAEHSFSGFVQKALGNDSHYSCLEECGNNADKIDTCHNADDFQDAWQSRIPAGVKSELYFTDKIAQEQYEAAVELGKKIESGQIEVSIKTGEGGKAFGSIASKEIATEVKAQMGLDVDKKKVQLKDAIKTLGTHTVPVKLHPKVTVDLKVIVTEEA